MVKLDLMNTITITIAALLGYGLMVTVVKIMQMPSMKGVGGLTGQSAA